MSPGAYRVDKRNLPAEQGKGVSCKEKGQSRSAKLERLLCEAKGGRAYLVQHQYPNPISSNLTWAALSFVRP